MTDEGGRVAAAATTEAPQTPEDRLASLAKPPGSLGLLETWAATLCHAQNSLTPTADPASVVVFCGDHGVKAAEFGISPFPPSVSQAVFRALAAGISATGVLTAAAGAHLTAVDVGIDGDVADVGGASARHDKVGRGTADFRSAPAMDDGAFDCALAAGAAALATEVEERGVRVVGVGEVGIGNTTASAAVLAMLLSFDDENKKEGEGGRSGDPGDCCGRGTGVDDEGLERKKTVVREACAFHREAVDAEVAAAVARERSAAAAGGSPETEARVRRSAHARAVLRRVGGFELVAMAGAFLEAAKPRTNTDASSSPSSSSSSSSSFRVVVLVDGFISAVAALAAVRMDPTSDGAVRRGMLFATQLAEEPSSPFGGGLLAAAIDAASPDDVPSCDTALSMGLRLGEASGAALAIPLARSAAAMVSRMGTLQEAMALGSGRRSSS